MEPFENIDAASIFDCHIFKIKEDHYRDLAPDSSEEYENICMNNYNLLKSENLRSISIPPTETFDIIASGMDPLDESNLIFKELLHPGFGATVTSGQKVLANYVMYCEGVLEPFDSTILREKPSCLKTGLGELIEGLELAVLSMKTKEIAKLIIKYPYAFGEVGCPPRIPPKSNILCYIELLKIIDHLQPVEEAGEFPSADIAFAAKIEECKKKIELGKSLSVNRKFEEGIKVMRLALNILQSLPLNNEEEQEILESLLVRVAVNLAAVFNHCNKPELACEHCHIALRINPTHQKALYNYGRAKIRLNNFAGAEKTLITGIKHYPKDPKFQEELARLKAKQADIAAREKNLK